MRSTLFAATAVCLTATTFCVSAQQAGTTRTLTLDECIDLALRHNLDIRIQQRNPLRFQYALDGSYAAYEPTFSAGVTRNFSQSQGRFLGENTFDPPSESYQTSGYADVGGVLPTGLSYTISSDLSRRDGPIFTSGVGVQLSQPVLRNFLIDSTRFNIEVRKNDLQGSIAGLSFSIMSVITSVETAFNNLYYTRENLKVQEQALLLAEKLLADNKTRVEVGALAPLDEKQSEAEVAARKSDLISAQEQLLRQQNVLIDLISDNFREWVGVSVVPETSLVAIPQIYSLTESWQTALEKRPDLEQQRLNLENQDLNIKFRRNQLLPDLSLVGGYGRSGLDNSIGRSLDTTRRGEFDSYNFGARLSLPLGNRAARTAFRSAKEDLIQAELGLVQFEQRILIEVDNAINTARAAYELVGSTKLAREYAEAALDAEQKKLENGKSTSFVVLQLQRDLTSARSAEIRALTTYQNALNELYFREGRTLERRNINIEVK